MKVMLKATGESWHVEKEVGQICIAISNGQLMELKESAQPAKLEITWGIGLTTEREEPYLTAKGTNGQTMSYFGSQNRPPVFFGHPCPDEIFFSYVRKHADYDPNAAPNPHAAAQRALREINEGDNHVVIVRN